MQALDLGRAVRRQVDFALEVTLQAVEIALEPFDFAGRLLLFEVEAFLLDVEAVHDCGGDGLFFAQRRDGLVGGQGLGLGGRGRACRQFDARRLRLHVGDGAFQQAARFQPLGVKDGALQGADFGGNLAILFGLAGLTLETRQGGVEFTGDIIEARQVGFGRRQTQFGLVTARVQA